MAESAPKPKPPSELFGPDPLADLPTGDYRRSRVRRRRTTGTARISLNLTAMIDVVFLLLIYFMAGTSFKLGEEIYRMDLPERGPSNAQRDPFELDDEPLRIRIASVGQRGRSYRIRVEGPYQQPDTFEELLTFLRERQIGPFTTRGLFEADHPIIIEPTRTARWEHAMGAFNAAARARYTNITFARPGG
ncbi:MAG: biopolymer transporter ExbD [Phycisphaerales bacterium]|nr:MAG: biopolymer transporter ExbD [Phycisphaerales bacterium]